MIFINLISYIFYHINMSTLRIAVLCGGPSLERGISLNSARSICDHLHSETIEIIPIYFDYQQKAYQIPRKQLYSNTPSDFDFKLLSESKPLDKEALIETLKKVDLAFPAIHGQFGEDGQIQELLESCNCPYIGPSAQACLKLFDKYKAHQYLEKHGFATCKTVLLEYDSPQTKTRITNFFQQNQLERAIVKPARGGSSIGVSSVTSPDEAYHATQYIFSEIDQRVILQPFIKGREFTVIVLQNKNNKGVALIPTEIEMNYKNNQIFDYRKKYLPSNSVTYHCPPRFKESIITKIQILSEKLFESFKITDFVRFDGWILDNGEIYFADFNPISGMEQNSFLFQQSSQLGMTHRNVLQYIVANACRRYNIDFPEQIIDKKQDKKDVHVIFGGDTAERQVSVMSGTNVWLKLKNSKKFNPKPFLLNKDLSIWELPYFLPLNHTVEEINAGCLRVLKNQHKIKQLRESILLKLKPHSQFISETNFLPKKITLEQFLEKSEFVFLGLHGGIGENGEMQSLLEKHHIYFNGPNSQSSQICINKYQTGITLESLKNEGISVAPKKLIKFKDFDNLSIEEYTKHWNSLKKDLQSSHIIVKPCEDGCSAGIVRLSSEYDLQKYINLINNHSAFIPPQTFQNQNSLIDMPAIIPKELLFEQFIETDDVQVIKNKLYWKTKTNWIEITVGVLGKEGNMKAFNPSITITSGEVLSVEEKFQGGTGVNITPPPSQYVPKEIVEKAKISISKVASILGIEGYARIDAFLNKKTGEIMIIEVNTLPGLTPSTVIYHQALAETPSIYPTEFLEKIVEFGYTRTN